MTSTLKRFVILIILAILIERSLLSKDVDSPQQQPTHANVAYSEHALCKLDIWIAEGDGPRPLLVHIHGGSWMSGDKEVESSQFHPFLSQGISCASINYRYASQNPLPDPVHDAARAIQYLRSRADDWNICKDRIVLTGNSAGGCTAAWLLFHDDIAVPDSTDPVLVESSRVSGAAIIKGQTSIDPQTIRDWLGPNVLKHPMISSAVGIGNVQNALKTSEEYTELYREFSPINHLTSDDPPLFMTYPEDMTLPSRSAEHGIHHGMYGVKVKEKADMIGTECHLLIPGTSESEKYKSATAFLLDKLLAP